MGRCLARTLLVFSFDTGFRTFQRRFTRWPGAILATVVFGARAPSTVPARRDGRSAPAARDQEAGHEGALGVRELRRDQPPMGEPALDAFERDGRPPPLQPYRQLVSRARPAKNEAFSEAHGAPAMRKALDTDSNHARGGVLPGFQGVLYAIATARGERS